MSSVRQPRLAARLHDVRRLVGCRSCHRAIYLARLGMARSSRPACRIWFWKMGFGVWWALPAIIAAAIFVLPRSAGDAEGSRVDLNENL